MRPAVSEAVQYAASLGASRRRQSKSGWSPALTAPPLPNSTQFAAQVDRRPLRGDDPVMGAAMRAAERLRFRRCPVPGDAVFDAGDREGARHDRAAVRHPDRGFDDEAPDAVAPGGGRQAPPPPAARARTS